MIPHSESTFISLLIRDLPSFSLSCLEQTPDVKHYSEHLFLKVTKIMICCDAKATINLSAVIRNAH